MGIYYDTAIQLLYSLGKLLHKSTEENFTRMLTEEFLIITQKLDPN